MWWSNFIRSIILYAMHISENFTEIDNNTLNTIGH